MYVGDVILPFSVIPVLLFKEGVHLPFRFCEQGTFEKLLNVQRNMRYTFKEDARTSVYTGNG